MTFLCPKHLLYFCSVLVGNLLSFVSTTLILSLIGNKYKIVPIKYKIVPKKIRLSTLFVQTKSRYLCLFITSRHFPTLTPYHTHTLRKEALRMLIYVMNNRSASYLDEKFYQGNQLNIFCKTRLLQVPMVKKSGATVFLSTVGILEYWLEQKWLNIPQEDRRELTYFYFIIHC